MESNFNIYRPALVRQIQSWFWLNNFMRPWILSLDKLIDVEGSTIIINLVGFNELYTERYFKGKMDKTAPALIDKLLKPNLSAFLKHTGYRGHSFKIVIRGRGEVFEKTLGIINTDWQ